MPVGLAMPGVWGVVKGGGTAAGLACRGEQGQRGGCVGGECGCRHGPVTTAVLPVQAMALAVGVSLLWDGGQFLTTRSNVTALSQGSAFPLTLSSNFKHNAISCWTTAAPQNSSKV